MKLYDAEVNNRKRLFGLDVLRALAITLVVICHLSRSWTSFLADYLGTSGVEIFFVLSGFLIGTILIKMFNEREKLELKQVKDFWIRRWFRTLPNYYLVLITLIILFSLFYYHDFMLKNLSYLAYFVFLQNAITPHPGFFPVAWSLAIEEWFYLLFPLWLLLLSKFSKQTKYKTLLISILSFILIISLFKAFVALNFADLDFRIVFRKMIPFRLDSIAIGVLAAMTCYYHKSFWNKIKTKSFVFGVVLFLAGSLYFYFDFVLNKNNNLITKIFFLTFLSISIAFLLPLMQSLKRFKNEGIVKFITHISLISYSVYLIHYFIIGGIDRLNLGNFSKIGISLILIFVVSTLQYRLFEKPITSIREKFSKSSEKTFSPLRLKPEIKRKILSAVITN